MSSVLKISGTAFASAHRPAVKATMSAGERRIMSVQRLARHDANTSIVVEGLPRVPRARGRHD